MSEWTGRCKDCESPLSAGASLRCRKCYLAQAAIHKERRLATKIANIPVRVERQENRLSRQLSKQARESEKLHRRRSRPPRVKRSKIFDALFRSVVFERIEDVSDGRLSPYAELEQVEAVTGVVRRLISERGLSRLEAQNLVLEYL